MKLYKCEKCGRIVAVLKEGSEPCGNEMKEIIPSSTDAAVEKHVPVFKVDGNRISVEVGEVPHPMTEPHWIEWIAIETKEGCQRKCLKPTDAPKAEFLLTENDALISVSAYCNLHGLWDVKNK